MIISYIHIRNKILFLFNNIDPFICTKLGYFVFEAFQNKENKDHDCNSIEIRTMIVIQLPY